MALHTVKVCNSDLPSYKWLEKASPRKWYFSCDMKEMWGLAESRVGRRALKIKATARVWA